ncbi:hypothetical protein FVA95_24030 [Pseudonocardia sp. EV170527-09]|uniref:hypothetical protein n=1 Tax=Pseudonocardia sp. EV170527-09 TaxID=2603411 RepID=UPI0011F3E09D|nr:hypothetical protein [Pseudonocardia sp. EV170527-09]KAA1018284.1 hypothetical protein FVA95_24030 [Pseudonocardia sp. EV170527-09]
MLVDEQPIRVLTEPVLLDDLASGDWFIGPSGELYEVSRPATAHPNGWTETTNLSMPVRTEQTLLAEYGGYEPGTGPRDGFFSFPGQEVLVERVLELAAAPQQGPLDDHGTSVLAALTDRWVADDAGLQSEAGSQ